MFKKIKKSDFLKSFLSLTLGSLVAQIITILTSPISTRIYSPKEMGAYTLLLSIVSIFGDVLSWRYDVLIVSAKTEREANNLVVGSIWINFISIAIISIGLVFFINTNATILDNFGYYSYVVILILFFTGTINIITYYNNRNKQYQLISYTQALRSFAQNTGMILFGIAKLGSVGLILSQVIGQVFGIKKQSEYLLKKRKEFIKIKRSEVLDTLLKYKKQPIFSLPAQFINSFSYANLNIIIESLYGAETLGFYSISYRILGLPLSIVSLNISKIFFQEASEELNLSGKYTKTVKKITILLLGLAIPMVLILMFIAPYIFEKFFGFGWSVSGEYVRILAPMYGIRFVVSALTPALIISHQQHLELGLQILFIICSIISYLITTFMQFEISTFLLIISVSYSMVYLVFFFVITLLSKGNKTTK